MKDRAEYLLDKYYELDNDIEGNYKRLLSQTSESGSIKYADDILFLMRCELFLSKSEYIQKQFNEIIKIYNDNNDKAGEFFAFTTYGISCRDLGNISEATKILNKAYKLALELNNFNLTVLGLINHICLDDRTAGSEPLLKVFKGAKKYVDKLTHSKIIGSYHMNYGYFLFSNSYLDEAMEHYEKALLAYNNFYNNKNASNILAVKVNIAGVYIKKAKYDEAINLYKEVYYVSEKVKDSSVSYICLEGLVESYELLEDYKNAFKYMKILNGRTLDLKRFNTKDNSEKLDEYLTEEISETKDNIVLYNLELKQKTLELEENLKRFYLISEVGKKLTSTTDEKQMFTLLVDTIHANVEADFIGLFIVDEKKRMITVKYTIDKNQSEWPRYEISFDNSASFSAYAARENRDLFINDTDLEAKDYVDSFISSNLPRDKHDIQSMIYCRLVNEGELIGLLTIQSSKKYAYDDMIFETIKSIAAYAAIAISNADKSRLLREKSLELEKLSYYDTLTGLKNRRSYVWYTEKLKNAADSFESFALLVADMNHLKSINDTSGHIEGDRYLVEIANILLEYGKDYEIFRLSGDEFGIIILNEGEDRVKKYIADVKDACSKIKHDDFPLSVAIGYSVSKKFDLKKLFNEAEVSMYEDKEKYYIENHIDRRIHDKNET